MHTNQRLFAEELEKRGAHVRVLDEAVELLEVSYGGEVEYVLDRASRQVSYVAAALAADKHLTKQMLKKNGICAPRGGLFDSTQASQALEFGRSLGYPLVVKPNVGSHGDGVRSGIANADQQEAAMAMLISEGKDHFVVERHIEGSEYRIFITSNGSGAALLREPASVVGDGAKTIKELAEEENLKRAAQKVDRGSALCPIAMDQIALDHLRRAGKGLGAVPALGQKTYLRLSSNLAQGGLSQDMTDLAHPDVWRMARKALGAFAGLPCLGIDLIVPDIAEPFGVKNPYAVIEVNANPGIAMHHMPALGSARDVASLLADAMFPQWWGQMDSGRLAKKIA